MAAGIRIDRRVLLIEVERRCFYVDCNQRVFIGLTKPEAMEYKGFECTACERWNADKLSRTDVVDWWDEIQSQENKGLNKIPTESFLE